MTLTWTRSKTTEPFLLGTRTHTVHETDLPTGEHVLVKSVDDLFFFYLDGKQLGWFDRLGEAKAAAQTAADKHPAKV